MQDTDLAVVVRTAVNQTLSQGFEGASVTKETRTYIHMYIKFRAD